MVVTNLTNAVKGLALQKLAMQWSRPLASLVLGSAVALTAWVGVQNYAAEAASRESDVAALAAISTLAQPSPLAQQRLPQPTSASAEFFPAAGRYLFGETPEANQIGYGYMVVESNGQSVFGALYYPQSSFDCFYGQVEGAELAMTIINSYSQEAYPYSIALVSDSAIASSHPDSLEPLSLEGFYAIDQISDNDVRMLEMCGTVVPTEI
jgi:hypothetical protein